MSDYELKKLMKGAEEHIRVPWWDELPVKGKRINPTVQGEPTDNENWRNEYEVTKDYITVCRTFDASEEVDSWIDLGWTAEDLETLGHIQKKILTARNARTFMQGDISILEQGMEDLKKAIDKKDAVYRDLGVDCIKDKDGNVIGSDTRVGYRNRTQFGIEDEDLLDRFLY